MLYPPQRILRLAMPIPGLDELDGFPVTVDNAPDRWRKLGAQSQLHFRDMSEIDIVGGEEFSRMSFERAAKPV
jgi:hypothetical protein